MGVTLDLALMDHFDPSYICVSVRYIDLGPGSYLGKKDGSS